MQMHIFEIHLQQTLNKLQTWIDTNGFKFSESKTVCVHFCTGMLTRPQSARPRPQTYDQGQAKAKATEVKAKAKAKTRAVMVKTNNQFNCNDSGFFSLCQDKTSYQSKNTSQIG